MLTQKSFVALLCEIILWTESKKKQKNKQMAAADGMVCVFTSQVPFYLFISSAVNR